MSTWRIRGAWRARARRNFLIQKIRNLLNVCGVLYHLVSYLIHKISVKPENRHNNTQNKRYDDLLGHTFEN